MEGVRVHSLDFFQFLVEFLRVCLSRMSNISFLPLVLADFVKAVRIRVLECSSREKELMKT